MAYVYRPMAPSDGFGNISAPLDELDLDAESEAFARDWWREEDAGGTFLIGYSDFMHRPAMVCAVAAAKLMCAGTSGKQPALTLLRMAIEELEKVPDEDA